ncbi:DNA (cytosine-5-)-methyltransferase [Epilithonimonas ginsengisoli]|uniref:Cytosine-specific methyltransferase n=1 Tax=Epilithonimonas ginsengisoli TaxID=1245592 RepID=A0ABU4JF24_9FLAO|nr:MULTISPECIES: DNA (cytosine-5-)-methyltransferase [Chryseobacterium group]MBV6879644.1 DNA cytosine methyltransferase [Epilithonimonas sp. FP105]MDW8548279.1 DNA (cytosine-5-)-methyltransferase [Epilithonimonas ginsengisoli]
MQIENLENEEGVVKEPQLEFLYYQNSKKETQKETLNVLSLFSGCGGMDLGFEGGFSVLQESVNEVLTPEFINRKLKNGFVELKKTKFKTVFANDILSDARNAWVNYFSKRGNNAEDFFQESIVDLVKMHKSGIPIFPNEIDIVTGGFPCQDFSLSGKRNGFNSHKNHKGELIDDTTASIETRGQLYMWMKEVIEITQPKIFIAENVKGLVNLDNVKEIIQNDFSSANGNGYIVLEPQVLHSANYGVPQSRERVIFIGIKKSALREGIIKELEQHNISEKYNPYPKPTHSYTDTGIDLKHFVQLKNIFKNLQEPENSNDLSQKSYSKAKFMGKHCQGQTEIKLSSISPTIRAEHHGNIEFRRLSRENNGKIESELQKGLIERRLTVRECALIQTFPPDYDFVIENKNGRKGSYLVSPSQAYKIIGNAVPPLLAYNLARRIEEVWDLYFKK